MTCQLEHYNYYTFCTGYIKTVRPSDVVLRLAHKTTSLITSYARAYSVANVESPWSTSVLGFGEREGTVVGKSMIVQLDSIVGFPIGFS